jgi:hypothetical protein
MLAADLVRFERHRRVFASQTTAGSPACSFGRARYGSRGFSPISSISRSPPSSRSSVQIR